MPSGPSLRQVFLFLIGQHVDQDVIKWASGHVDCNLDRVLGLHMVRVQDDGNLGEIQASALRLISRSLVQIIGQGKSKICVGLRFAHRACNGHDDLGVAGGRPTRCGRE